MRITYFIFVWSWNCACSRITRESYEMSTWYGVFLKLLTCWIQILYHLTGHSSGLQSNSWLGLDGWLFINVLVNSGFSDNSNDKKIWFAERILFNTMYFCSPYDQFYVIFEFYNNTIFFKYCHFMRIIGLNQREWMIRFVTIYTTKYYNKNLKPLNNFKACSIWHCVCRIWF